MRTRLLVATVALVAGTLVLASLGSFLLIRRDSFSSTESQVQSQVAEIAAQPALLTLRVPGPGPLRFRCCVHLLRVVGGFSSLNLNALEGGQLVRALPPPLRGLSSSTKELEAGHAISGHVGERVYVLYPVPLTATQRARLAPHLPASATAVLVATRRVSAPAGGLGYFAVVGAIVLAIAAAVSYALSVRMSRPLRDAVRVTGRIAAGELEARVPVASSAPPELVSLADSINAMGSRLQEAREQQRQFLLSVSHDLRTPLTSISGYAQAVADGTAKDVPGAVAVIRSEAARLDRMVGDLLDLARLEAGRFTFRPAPTDVAALLTETVESFGPAAQHAGVVLSADLLGEVVLRTDRDRVRQLVANLIDNALRFARSSVQVGVRSEGQGVLLWVTDDGAGIPQEDLHRIWERHFTADSAGKGRSGTGLGLAIVAELTAAMHGVVRAESPVTTRGGTRMSVRLPPL